MIFTKNTIPPLLFRSSFLRWPQIVTSTRKGICFSLSLLVMTLSLACFGQVQPAVKNFTPVDYVGENQNWDISQSAEKLIYVANSKGLLEFNGAFWKHYLSPNESIMRSVKVVDDLIYTGCYMEFGFWKKNELQQLEYTSISDGIRGDLIEDEEFWNIISIDDWIVFQSLKRVYIYNVNEKTIKFIDSPNTITKIFEIDQEIYFQSLKEGIYRINDGKAVLFSDNNIFKVDEIINIFGNREELLVITKESGIYNFNPDSGKLVKSVLYSNPSLLGVSIYDAISLKNKNFAIGTIANGLFIINPKGEVVSQIDLNQGLINNTVLTLYEDIDSNTWVGLDNGISYITLDSAYEMHNERSGVLGSVYASRIHDGNLYLGTNQGLFFRKIGSTDDFKLIKGTNGQVWSLKLIDNLLLCGHHLGTFIINEDKAELISDVKGTWNIAGIDSNPNLLLQGNYDGLYVLQRVNGYWKLRNKIDGFNSSSRYFEVVNKDIFVNHEYKGVFKLEVDDTYSRVKSVSIDSSLRGSNSGMAKYNESLIYAFKNGVFKYDVLEGKFLKDSLLSSAYTEKEYESGKLIVDEVDNILWIFSKTNIIYVTPTGLSKRQRIKNIPLTSEVRNGIIGYENISSLGKNKYLLGTTSGYTIINQREQDYNEFSVYIDQVVNHGKEYPKEMQSLTNTGEFKYGQNNFKISYFAPEYNQFVSTQYQYQLLGIYDDWSGWSTKSTASFENLPHGEYTFNVRAKIGNIISGNVASYSFENAKPWYSSNTMLWLYLVSFIVIVLLTHNLYKRYYKKQREDLIAKNERELNFTRLKNEREIIKLKNDKLQLDFSSKSKELAASLMSIASKNDLLRSVKSELGTADKTDDVSIKSVINTINKSLKQDDDWEFFQEAFNNADSDFLQNLKLKHPALTPSDLKLCGYLRLNLSTKEMSNLLNITTRSVEIKRYRLRKKLDLQHEDNLVSYILGL